MIKHQSIGIVCFVLAWMGVTGCHSENQPQEVQNHAEDKQEDASEETVPPIAVLVKNPVVKPQPAVEPIGVPVFDDDDSGGWDCVTVDLSTLESPRESVRVRNDKGNVTIDVRGGWCIGLTGSHKGSVTVSTASDRDIYIILDNVSIDGTESAGYLKLKLNDKDHIQDHAFNLFLKGTNTIEGGFTADSKEVLESKSKLFIMGDGTLRVTAHYKTAIAVEDEFHIWTGTVYANVDRTDKTTWKKKDKDPKPEKGFGIKVGNAFEMIGGALVVTSKDTVIPENCEARGIKVDGVESDYGARKGYIDIKGGDIFIQSDAKALSAGWDREDDAKTETTVDDPIPDLRISGGRVRISTFATPRDEMWTENTLSPEGLEGKHDVVISGGEVIVKATDDAINAGNMIHISGGKVVAWSSDNDAIDGNRSVVISGGTVIAFGSTGPEGGIDADSSRNVVYHGGVVFALGGDNNAPTGTGTVGSFAQYGAERKGGMGGPGGGPGNGPGFGMPGFPPGPPPDGMRPGDRRGEPQGDRRGPGGMQGHGGPGGMGGPGMRKKSFSEFASKTLALTQKDNNALMVSLSVPENYSGGTNVLILHPEIIKDAAYALYTDAKVEANDSTQVFDFGDGIRLTLQGSVTGTEIKDITGGVSVGGMGPGAMPWPMEYLMWPMMQLMPHPMPPGHGGKNRHKPPVGV